MTRLPTRAKKQQAAQGHSLHWTVMLQRRKKKRSGITVNCATTYEDKTQRKELYSTH